MPGADEDDVSRAPRHDDGAPEGERPQKDLAQLRVCLDETSHAFRGQLEDTPRLTSPSARDGRTVRYEIDVAGKVALTVDGNDGVPVGEDLDLASEYDQERTIHLALLPQNLADGKRPLPREGRDPRDLLGRQHRKDVALEQRSHEGPVERNVHAQHSPPARSSGDHGWCPRSESPRSARTTGLSRGTKLEEFHGLADGADGFPAWLRAGSHHTMNGMSDELVG